MCFFESCVEMEGDSTKNRPLYRIYANKFSRRVLNKYTINYREVEKEEFFGTLTCACHAQFKFDTILLERVCQTLRERQNRLAAQVKDDIDKLKATILQSRNAEILAKIVDLQKSFNGRISLLNEQIQQLVRNPPNESRGTQTD